MKTPLAGKSAAETGEKSVPETAIESGPDLQRADQTAQGRDGAERGQHAGAGIGRRGHVFDRHLETDGVGLDLDRMGVPGNAGIGPNLDGRPVGPDAGKAQCHGHVDVGRKALHRRPRRPVEDLERRR